MTEQVIALLARVHQDPPNADRPATAAEFRGILRGIKNNQPALFIELQPRVEQLRSSIAIAE